MEAVCSKAIYVQDLKMGHCTQIYNNFGLRIAHC